MGDPLSELLQRGMLCLQKQVFQQIELAEKRVRLGSRSDYITLELKVRFSTQGRVFLCVTETSVRPDRACGPETATCNSLR